uniref:Uncharacterized LOC103029820 n=1 Tax=Astyanax mexicanus TaxID=7994 RepID=A0A3B1IQE6_ASTMX
MSMSKKTSAQNLFNSLLDRPDRSGKPKSAQRTEIPMAVSKFNKANRSLTKAQDFRDDFSMYMQPYCNWERLLESAPQSIALFGELIRVSSEEDFSINKNAPKDGFQFIKYPESFKACLLQVCNLGWQAFNEAHKNMDQIRLYTGQVPDYIRHTVDILIQEDNDLVKAFLPAVLQNIENISSECLKLVSATEEKFSDVVKLMQEFVEALVNARQGYNVELEEIKKKIQAEKLREKSAEEAKKRVQAEYEKVKDHLAEDRKRYEKALDGLPSGWSLLGQKILSSFTEQAMSVSAGIAISKGAGAVDGYIHAGVNVVKVIGGVVNTFAGMSTTSQATPEENNKTDEEIATTKILSQSNYILILSVEMNRFYTEDKINWAELYDQKEKAARSDYLKKNFENAKESINKEGECKVKNEALDICNKGIDICTELAKYAPKGECDDAKAKEQIKAIKDLNTKALTFDSKSKAYTGRPALSGAPPHSSRQQNKEVSGKDFIQLQTELAYFQIEQSEKLLKQTTERYDKYLENVERSSKELDNIVIELQGLIPKEMDFNKKIKVLAKGLAAMGNVRQQWENLVSFFQMLSNLIKTTLTVHLKNFNQTVDTTVKYNYTYSEFVKDQIYMCALNASATAYMINMISTTYTEVSNSYLMTGISTLGRLMTMDPNGQEFIATIVTLKGNYTSAKDNISKLVTANKTNFKLKCQNRITQIQTVLYEVLPQISEEKKLAMKAAVKNGIEPQSEKQEETKSAAEIKPMTQEEESQFY